MTELKTYKIVGIILFIVGFILLFPWLFFLYNQNLIPMEANLFFDPDTIRIFTLLILPIIVFTCLIVGYFFIIYGHYGFIEWRSWRTRSSDLKKENIRN